MRASIVSSGRLLKAAAEYHEDEGDREHYQNQQDEYTSKVLKAERDFFNSPARLNDLLSVLRSWKATRFKDSDTIVPNVLREWIPAHITPLKNISRRPLENLRDEDFAQLKALAKDLSGKGIKPTCYGKTLAFLMPETALIWDDSVVRGLYKFEATPAQYAGYHRMVCKLARELMHQEGVGIIREIERKHAEVANACEPFAKIVDELAYERAWILFACKEIRAWPF